MFNSDNSANDVIQYAPWSQNDQFDQQKSFSNWSVDLLSEKMTLMFLYVREDHR